MQKLKDWSTTAGIALLCILAGVVGTALVLIVLMAYAAAVGGVIGAFVGGIGGGAYIAFTWLSALF